MIQINIYIFSFVVALLIFFLILFHFRLNEVATTNKSIQKHIVYQQQCIEKLSRHLIMLQKKSGVKKGEKKVAEEEEAEDEENFILDANDEMKDLLFDVKRDSLLITPSNRRDEIVQKSEPPKEQVVRTAPPPNPMGNLLPLVSSVMTMMTNATESGPSMSNIEVEEIDATVNEKKEDDLKKKQLLLDLKEELSELDKDKLNNHDEKTASSLIVMNERNETETIQT